MAITRALADTYFDEGNHVLAKLWEAFDRKDRDGAIAHAKRRLEQVRAVAYPTNTSSSPVEQNNLLDEDTTSATDFPREDLACYEQALHMLIFGTFVPLPNDHDTRWIDRVNAIREEGGDAYAIAPEARRLMGWEQHGVRIARGS